jgi:phage baseplate assembly protein W
MADLPHIAFPFERDARTGKVRVVEQDTPEHVNSCCQTIIRCPTGFREDRPDFGIPYPEFRTAPFDVTAIRDQIRDLEPRAARVTIVQWQDASDGPAVYRLSIDVEYL